MLGELAAFQVGSIAAMFGVKGVDFNALNPYKPPMSARNRSLAARDSKEQFKAAQRREERHGKKRINVRHYPILVKG